MKPTPSRSRPRLRLAVLPILLALLASSAWAAELKVGDTFPDLSSFGLEGGLPASLKGKIVVVDFWASWCGACRRTFPVLEELHHRFGKQGLVILAVNEDKSAAGMKEFLKEYPVTFNSVRDAKKKLAAEVQVPALPSSYILDGDGKVLSIQSGDSLLINRRKFIKEIEELLARNTKKP